MGKPIAIVSALLLLLTYLLIESQSSDQLPRLRMQQALQAMQLHDAELNRDVLMARAGLLTNYDSLAQTGRKLSLDMEVLERESAVLARRAAGLIGSAAALAGAPSQADAGRVLEIRQRFAAQFIGLLCAIAWGRPRARRRR